jgi:hypothetical protein
LDADRSAIHNASASGRQAGTIAATASRRGALGVLGVGPQVGTPLEPFYALVVFLRLDPTYAWED